MPLPSPPQVFPDSPYFQSEIFNGILLFLQNGTNKGKLKQVGKNGILVVEDIKTMSELFSFLDKMKKALSNKSGNFFH